MIDCDTAPNWKPAGHVQGLSNDDLKLLLKVGTAGHSVPWEIPAMLWTWREGDSDQRLSTKCLILIT